MAQLIDISLPLNNSFPAWPGHKPMKAERILKIEEGARCNLTSLSLSAHTGTHIDAPCHSIAGADTVEDWPLDRYVGRAQVVDAGDIMVLTPDVLNSLDIRPDTEKLIVKTRNSDFWRTSPETFVKEFTALDDAGAQWIVDHSIKVIGVDYLSIELFHNEPAHSTHRILLNAGVMPIEGLDLRNVEPGIYEMMCLPLRLQNADGAPARVLLRTLD